MTSAANTRISASAIADTLETDAVARARALAGVVEGQSLANEEARTLTPIAVEALRESRLLLGFLPSEVGGEERSPTELLMLVEEISRQDASTGWCFGMNGFITGICAAALPDAGLAEVYPDRAEQVLIAGGFPPLCRASRDGDGWRVTGHMRFGSGIRHADHVACTAIEFDGDAPRMDGAIPQMRTFVVPREQVRIDDNWDVAGLQGTGSCDYHLENHFVADHLSFISSTLRPLRGQALYGLPLLSIAAAPHAGFALGVGRRALDEIAAHAGWRQRLASPSPLAKRGAFQRDYARARTRLAAARTLTLDRFRALDEANTNAAGATLADRAEVTAATTFAYESALEAAQVAFRAAGASALYRSNPLQRCLRDIQAGMQHIVPSDESWERVAQLWLGVGEPGMI